MLEKGKKIIKTFAIILIVLVTVVLSLGLMAKYTFSWKLTDVGTETSPDGRYRLLFQAVGEADFPFGSSHAKVTLYNDNKKIQSFREDIADDGASFRSDNYCVEWMPYGVVITFMGSEQANHEVEMFYDGSDSFVGYTDMEIESILKDRYHFASVEIIERDNNGYHIKANGITFYADNTLSLHDSYRQELVKAMTEEVFSKRIHRGLEWDKQEGATPADIVYTPIISMNDPAKQDIDSFCSDICKWLEYCFTYLPYEEGKDAYTGFIPAIPDYQNVKIYFSSYNWSLECFKESNTNLYDSLCIFLNQYIDHELDAIYNITNSKL